MSNGRDDDVDDGGDGDHYDPDDDGDDADVDYLIDGHRVCYCSRPSSSCLVRRGVTRALGRRETIHWVVRLEFDGPLGNRKRFVSVAN